MAETQEVREKCRDVVVSLPKVIGHVPCLFFGKCGAVLSLKSNIGHPTGSTYNIGAFVCPVLEEKLMEVWGTLGISYGSSQICRLTCGVYVHVYGPKMPLVCSSVTLSKAASFFTFKTAGTTLALPQNPTINVLPFLHSNADLLYMDSSNREVVEAMKVNLALSKYTWATAPDHPWDWPEYIWAERLLCCLKESQTMDGLQIFPAFRWQPNTYKVNIGTIFQNVGALPVAPFQGMTDILILGPSDIALLSLTPMPLCCIEVGIKKEATTPIVIGRSMKTWPEKLGELLASMYYFATCNYINNLRTLPVSVNWSTYGVFTVRSMSCLILKMELDSGGCHVELLYEGTNLSLGAAIEYVVQKIKK